MRKTVVYLHGVGGATRRDQWLDSLNTALTQIGSSPLRHDFDEVIDVDYSSVLRAAHSGAGMEPTIKQQNGDDRDGNRLLFLQNNESAKLAIQIHESRDHGDLSGVPGWLVDGMAPIATRVAVLKDAHLYRVDETTRAAVQRLVLSHLPKDRELILIGHSLGSVVALDLVRHLPVGQRVRLLLTVGSPLSTPTLWPFLKDLRDPGRFPYERVMSWVNVYDGRDPVAGWSRLSQAFPMALDVPVQIGGSHAVLAYFSHPAVAAALGEALYGRTTAGPSDKRLSKRISPDWNPTLLAFEFSNQLSRSCASDRSQWKQRFDIIRRVQAERTLAEVSVAHDANPDVEALERPPTVNDLLTHAVEHVRDVWSDEELLPLVVSLFVASPTAPFDLSISEEHRRVAMTQLLENVRRRSGSLSASEFVRIVEKSLRKSAEAFGRSSGGGAWVWLAGAGLVVLAATGVGLVAAVPAGLAGAAAITSTLAAFGPGGMVGGMVTIAALTGTGSAFLGAGAGGSGGDRGASTEVLTSSEFLERSARALSAMSVEELRGTLAAALAVCDAGRALGQEDRGPRLRLVLDRTLADAANELELHKRLSPKGKSKDSWKKRVELLERALDKLQADAGADAEALKRLFESSEMKAISPR